MTFVGSSSSLALNGSTLAPVGTCKSCRKDKDQVRFWYSKIKKAFHRDLNSNHAEMLQGCLQESPANRWVSPHPSA